MWCGGPVLLSKRKNEPFQAGNLADSRHPRTCACLRNRHQLLLITVDGRNEEAQGMTLVELTALTKALGCKNAINLDGGGSTTMWVKASGVVNMPSDNGRFDHLGERPCANVIIVY